jgi:hypothetical protein
MYIYVVFLYADLIVIRQSQICNDIHTVHVVQIIDYSHPGLDIKTIVCIYHQ